MTLLVVADSHGTQPGLGTDSILAYLHYFDSKSPLLRPARTSSYR